MLAGCKTERLSRSREIGHKQMSSLRQKQSLARIGNLAYGDMSFMWSFVLSTVHDKIWLRINVAN